MHPMHPEIAKTTAARRADEMHATAAAWRLTRQARGGRAAGSAAAHEGRNSRRQRRLGRQVAGRPQSA